MTARIPRGARGPLTVVASLCVAAVVWEAVGQLRISPLFPPFTQVVATAIDVWRSARFTDSARDTLLTLLLAFPASLAAGVLVGILMGVVDVVDWALDLWVAIFISLPLIALIPIIVLIFGVGRESNVVIVFLSVFFPVVVNARAGVRSVSAYYSEMARSFGSGRWHTLSRIVLPGSLPLVLAGCRVATGRAIRGVIYAETIIGVLGIGGLLQGYAQAFRIPEMWVLLMTIGAVGLGAMELVRYLEKKLLARYPQGRTAADA